MRIRFVEPRPPGPGHHVYDTATVEQADRTVTFAEHVQIDTIQLMIETPLPGTRL